MFSEDEQLLQPGQGQHKPMSEEEGSGTAEQDYIMVRFALHL